MVQGHSWYTVNHSSTQNVFLRNLKPLLLCLQNNIIGPYSKPVQSSSFRRILFTLDCIMAQAVSRRPFTAEARIRSLVTPCVISGGQSDTVIRFSPSSFVVPCSYYFAVALYTHMSPGGRAVGPLVASVQRCNLTPSILTTWTTLDTFWNYPSNRPEFSKQSLQLRIND